MSKFKNSFNTLDNVNAIVLVANKKGEIVFANKAVKTILGFEPKDVLGDGWWILTNFGAEFDKRKSETANLASGNSNINERHLFEHLLPTKSGGEVWTQWTNTLTDDGLLVGVAQDITEKKILEEKLASKLRENELLLKEVHHRVKNNLQIVTSLLNLQFKDISDEKIIEAVDKSKDRLRSMALIHTKLYQTDNLDSINFGEYIEELSAYISNSYSPNDNITLSVNHSGEMFDINLSINLGLIITELLTNAYIHAFDGKAEGSVKITVSKQENLNKLVLEDNGNGISENDVRKDSLGLEIVNALIEQINGEIETINSSGTNHIITF